MAIINAISPKLVLQDGKVLSQISVYALPAQENDCMGIR